MAKIRRVYDDTIRPDGSRLTIYPITSTRAVYTPSSVSLDTILNEGYRFGGVVKPNDSVPFTDQRVWYIGPTPGRYPNFGNLEVRRGYIGAFYWDGARWGMDNIPQPEKPQSDWEETDELEMSFIKNKPVLAGVALSGDYNGLINTPDLAEVALSGSYDDLLDKPELSAVATSGDYNDLLNTPNLATVATSGNYNDLTNKPTIPAAQVNSNWNATSGVAQILNKPTLATVATSGNYNDLSNKPAVVNESVVSGWGFTKNIGTVTTIKINGGTYSPTNGVVDLGSQGASVASLNDIGDVVISSPSSGQILSWNGSNWVNVANPAANAVLYTSQSLNTAQQLQARNNISVHNVQTSTPSGGMLPNVCYELGTITSSRGFSLASTQSGEYGHYYFTFSTGSTAPTITWPSGITWAKGAAPVVSANAYYEISILDGVAVYLEKI